MSADPLTVHGLGADANGYAYVSGEPLRGIDDVGLDDPVANPAHAAFLRHKAAEPSVAAGLPDPANVAQPASQNPLNRPELRARLAEVSGKSEIASTPTQWDPDHIVSFKELKVDPRFRQLTAEQQMEVLHMKENLSMLARDVNQKLKGGKSLDEFAREYNIKDPRIDRMVENARAALASRLDAMVAKNVAQRVNPMVESAKYLKKYFPKNQRAQAAFEHMMGRLSAAQRKRVGSWPVPVAGPQSPSIGGKVPKTGLRGPLKVGRAAGIGIGLITIGADLYKFFRGDYDRNACDPPDCG